MKIIYLSRSILPSQYANSVHVMHMAEAMSQLGHDVLLYGMDGDVDTETTLHDYYGVSNSFEILRLKKRSKYSHPISYFEVLMKLRQGMPELVYGRALTDCWSAVQLGYPVIFETHQPPEQYGTIQRVILNSLLRSPLLKRLVVISEPLYDSYLQYGVPQNRVLVAHDAASESIPKQVALGNGARMQIGYIGHLYSGRGINIVVELARRCVWADFHVIGGMEEDVSDWRMKANDISNIVFHGFMKPAIVQDYMRACDVLLAPYQEVVTIAGGINTVDWMSPLKIFEYMASGTPVVASDLPSLRRILKSEETCLMCQPSDVGEWINAISKLRDNIELRRHLAESAYAEFRAKYTWEARARNVLTSLNMC